MKVIEGWKLWKVFTKDRNGKERLLKLKKKRKGWELDKRKTTAKV